MLALEMLVALVMQYGWKRSMLAGLLATTADIDDLLEMQRHASERAAWLPEGSDDLDAAFAQAYGVVAAACETEIGRMMPEHYPQWAPSENQTTV